MEYIDSSDQEAYQLICQLRESKEPKCSICLCVQGRPTASPPCQHSFCYSCIRKWAESSNQCPQCRSQFYSLQIKEPQRLKLMNQSKDLVVRNSIMRACVTKYRENWTPRGEGFIERIPPVYFEDCISEEEEEDDDDFYELTCMVCKSFEQQETMYFCGRCEKYACHIECQPQAYQGEGPWLCLACRWCKTIL